MFLLQRLNRKIKIVFVYSQAHEDRDDRNMRKKLEQHLSTITPLGVEMKWCKPKSEAGQYEIL